MIEIDSIDRALQRGAYNGHLGIVKYLVQQGADIHAWDEHVLGCAAIIGRFDVVKYLVEQGADIHARNDLALRNAASRGHLDIVNYLIEQGANSETITS